MAYPFEIQIDDAIPAAERDANAKLINASYVTATSAAPRPFDTANSQAETVSLEIFEGNLIIPGTGETAAFIPGPNAPDLAEGVEATIGQITYTVQYGTNPPQVLAPVNVILRGAANPLTITTAPQPPAVTFGVTTVADVLAGVSAGAYSGGVAPYTATLTIMRGATELGPTDVVQAGDVLRGLVSDSTTVPGVAGPILTRDLDDVALTSAVVNVAPTLSATINDTAENVAIGTAIGTFTATGTPAPTVTLTGALAAVAQINGTNIETTAALDFETTTSYAWTLTAANSTLPDATQSGTMNVIDVADTPPAGLAISASTIAENAAIGDVIGTLSVTTGNPAPTYSLTSNPGGFFAIVGNELRVAAALDFETNTSHSLVIEASNGNVPADTLNLTVTVTDIADSQPTAAGGLADLALTENVAMTAVDVATDFTGADTYALAPASAALPAGLTLSAAGVLSGTPTASQALSAIVVRGTNTGSGLFADTAFNLTVNAADLTANLGFGVTTVTGGTSQGTYVAGEHWFNGGGAVMTADVQPLSTQIDRPTSTGGQTGPTWANGAMIDPGNAARYSSASEGDTIAQKQAVNYGRTNGDPGQGYDEWDGSNNLAYNDTHNAGKAAIALSQGTILKAFSDGQSSSIDNNARPALDDLVPLTFVTSEPPAGSFRPAHASTDKTPVVNVSDVNLGVLGNRPAGALAIPAAATCIAAARFVSWQHTYNVLSRNIMVTGAPVYGGDRWEALEGILACQYDAWTAAEKQEFCYLAIQNAIDICGRIREGGIFQDNGGHPFGTYEWVAFAHRLTGLAYFQDCLNQLVEGTMVNGGTVSPIGASVFGGIAQVGTITQAIINEARSIPYTQDMLGYPEWGGDFTRGVTADLENHLSLGSGSWAADTSNNVGYRKIAAQNSAAPALALRMMGFDVTAEQTWFDYWDRYMQERIAVLPGNLAGITANNVSDWVVDAWQADRAALGNEWMGTSAPTTISIAEPQLPIYDGKLFAAVDPNIASIPLSGTHDGGAGAALQYRLVDSAGGGELLTWQDFTANGAATWEVNVPRIPSWQKYRAEVRARDATTVNDAQANGWYAGFAISAAGQSLFARPLTAVDVALAFTPQAESMWVLQNDINGTLANGPIEVTAASPLGQRRMAANVRAYSTAPVLVIDNTNSGTGRGEAVDDQDTGSDWQTVFQDPVDYVTSRGSTVTMVPEHWFTNDSAWANEGNAEFGRQMAPYLADVLIGGAADAPDASGVTDYNGEIINVIPSRPYGPIEHSLFSLRSVSSGRELFDHTVTKWVPIYGASHRNSTVTLTDGEIATDDEFKGRVREGLRYIAEDATEFEALTLSSATGYPGTAQEGFGGHIAMPGGTHVKVGDVDGESLAGAYIMRGMMAALGFLPRNEPMPASAAWEGNGAYVDITFDGLNGEELTTPFIRHAAGDFAGTFEGDNWVAPTTLPGGAIPEIHEVMGFAIIRGGVWTFINFTAVIQDAAAGVVRITPTVAFENGDQIAYGYGDGYHMLTQADVDATRPQQRHLVTRSTHVSGTGYGRAAVRQSANAALFTASGITAAPTGPDHTNSHAMNGTEYFDFGDVGANISLIRHEFEFCLPAGFANFTGRRAFAGIVSQGFDVFLVNDGASSYYVDCNTIQDSRDNVNMLSGAVQITPSFGLGATVSFTVEADLANDVIRHSANGGSETSTAFDAAALTGKTGIWRNNRHLQWFNATGSNIEMEAGVIMIRATTYKQQTDGNWIDETGATSATQVPFRALLGTDDFTAYTGYVAA